MKTNAKAEKSTKAKPPQARRTITEQELTQQIGLILPDFFISEIRPIGDKILKMNFPSGESFLVCIEKNN